MSNNILFNDNFLETCKKTTLKTFENKINSQHIYQLLDNMPTSQQLALPTANQCCMPSPIGADASLISIAIWSKIKCYPDNLPWKFEATAWGPGIGGGGAAGFMYTIYECWDMLFDETAGYHAQGVAEGGGIFQITWFTKNALPIGQFNGFLAGIGVFEVGGSGHWTCR